MNEIVDLILPSIYYDKAKALQELNKKYLIEYENINPQAGLLLDSLHKLSKKLLLDQELIEYRYPPYDVNFWLQVAELNQTTLKKINYQLCFTGRNKVIYFTTISNYRYKSIIYFWLDEIDAINNQYKLLQQRYYSRYSL